MRMKFFQEKIFGDNLLGWAGCLARLGPKIHQTSFFSLGLIHGSNFFVQNFSINEQVDRGLSDMERSNCWRWTEKECGFSRNPNRSAFLLS